MRKLLSLILFVCLSVTATAQDDFQVRRGDCMPDLEITADGTLRAPALRRLPAINTQWDANKTYHQLVILVSFSDTDFTMDNPQDVYNRMFNEQGYNQRSGVGCVAEYFRTQSNGLLNLQFDVYGPYKIGSVAQPVSNPNANTRNYGRDQMIEATNMFLNEHPEIDFTQYDWNGNGYVNQVIYIFAGLTGNISHTDCYGHIWPNTSTFSNVKTPDNLNISSYTCSCEHWPTTSKALCGLGTVCHEYTHSLGLPDLYPTSSNAGYSVVDEWDLMDGGNFTNYGWCPPNYSPLEKMLLGWLIPVELTEPTTVTQLKPVAEGGEAYRIKHSDNEWLLLENRQQRGWDKGAPGSGLVIYHVFYDKSEWSGNRVNNDKTRRRYDLVHADNMDYDQWGSSLGGANPYKNSNRMNSRLLSGSPYPWTDGTTVNNELTDTSTPASVMFYPNLESSTLLGKPITNIVVNENGYVSFDFMGGSVPTEMITSVKTDRTGTVIYDLNGRCVSQYMQGINLVRQADGKVKKVLK